MVVILTKFPSTPSCGMCLHDLALEKIRVQTRVTPWAKPLFPQPSFLSFTSLRWSSCHACSSSISSGILSGLSHSLSSTASSSFFTVLSDSVFENMGELNPKRRSKKEEMRVYQVLQWFLKLFLKGFLVLQLLKMNLPSLLQSKRSSSLEARSYMRSCSPHACCHGEKTLAIAWLPTSMGGHSIPEPHGSITSQRYVMAQPHDPRKPSMKHNVWILSQHMQRGHLHTIVVLNAFNGSSQRKFSQTIGGHPIQFNQVCVSSGFRSRFWPTCKL